MQSGQLKRRNLLLEAPSLLPAISLPAQSSPLSSQNKPNHSKHEVPVLHANSRWDWSSVCSLKPRLVCSYKAYQSFPMRDSSSSPGQVFEIPFKGENHLCLIQLTRTQNIIATSFLFWSMSIPDLWISNHWFICKNEQRKAEVIPRYPTVLLSLSEMFGLLLYIIFIQC